MFKNQEDRAVASVIRGPVFSAVPGYAFKQQPCRIVVETKWRGCKNLRPLNARLLDKNARYDHPTGGDCADDRHTLSVWYVSKVDDGFWLESESFSDPVGNLDWQFEIGSRGDYGTENEPASAAGVLGVVFEDKALVARFVDVGNEAKGHG